MSRMLKHHFKNLIGINHFATITLVSDTAPLTDQSFSIGTTQALHMLSTYYDKVYNFLDLAPDRDLRRRGFDLDPNTDKLNWYYREDGLRLFDVILNYTTSVLQTVYKSEQDFLNDAKT